MKKILSLSKMKETLSLPYVNGKAKRAVFFKDKETELSDDEYKFLVAQKDGPFNFLINEGTFKLINSKDEKPEEKSDGKTKLEKQLEALQAEKIEIEAKGRQFHHKKETKMKRLIIQIEDAKNRAGE